MAIQQLSRGGNRTGSNTSIWLALVAALGFHAIFLFLPISRQVPVSENIPAQIELQLVTFSPTKPVQQIPEPLPEAVPEPLPETEPPEVIIEPEESIAEVTPELSQPAPAPVSNVQVQDIDFADMSEPEKSRITQSILSARFFTQESEADKLFGKPLEIPERGQHGDFYHPIHQDMISMLDRPMQDLPFAYTPGLVRFAYDPGVRGDLQRFWDVITPEFGWRTNNGTEFRCVLVLVIIGCGWK